jgi:hypothetical protein
LPGSRAPWNRFAGRGRKGHSPPNPGKKSQLEPSRDGENMKRDREEPIPDMVKEDQWPQSEKIITKIITLVTE